MAGRTTSDSRRGFVLVVRSWSQDRHKPPPGTCTQSAYAQLSALAAMGATGHDGPPEPGPKDTASSESATSSTPWSIRAFGRYNEVAQVVSYTTICRLHEVAEVAAPTCTNTVGELDRLVGLVHEYQQAA
jgi:hypothetical protein